jgi:hypothetical protein
VTDDLTESCAQIAAWLTAAQALTATPDTDGSTGRGQPASRPPWNPAAENAAMDAWEGLRRLEASLRLAVNGHPGTRRGPSDANTQAAITAIERLGTAVTVPAMAAACRILDHWSRQIQQLPAIDRYEPWRRVGGTCPYCAYPMLWAKRREGTVTCLRYGTCRDADGRHPVGHMDVSRLDGDGVIRWQDGLVT